MNEESQGKKERREGRKENWEKRRNEAKERMKPTRERWKEGRKEGSHRKCIHYYDVYKIMLSLNRDDKKN